MNIKAIGCDVSLSEMIQNVVHWRAFVKSVMNISFSEEQF
jgi:hypothetical protein